MLCFLLICKWFCCSDGAAVSVLQVRVRNKSTYSKQNWVEGSGDRLITLKCRQHGGKVRLILILANWVLILKGTAAIDIAECTEIENMEH